MAPTKIAVHAVCAVAQAIGKNEGVPTLLPLFDNNAVIIGLDEDSARVLAQILEAASGEFELAEKLMTMLHQRRVATKLNQTADSAVA